MLASSKEAKKHWSGEDYVIDHLILLSFRRWENFSVPLVVCTTLTYSSSYEL